MTNLSQFLGFALFVCRYKRSGGNLPTLINAVGRVAPQFSPVVGQVWASIDYQDGINSNLLEEVAWQTMRLDLNTLPIWRNAKKEAAKGHDLKEAVK